jgi:hypothetical protein
MPQLIVSLLLIAMLNQTIWLMPMMEAVPAGGRDTQTFLGFIAPFRTLYVASPFGIIDKHRPVVTKQYVDRLG